MKMIMVLIMTALMAIMVIIHVRFGQRIWFVLRCLH